MPQGHQGCTIFFMSLCSDSSTVEFPLFQGGDGGAIPTSPLQLNFRQITSKTSNIVVSEMHYAKRAVPVVWAFGAYFNNILHGVISFGKPASPHVCFGICGRENSERVYELNRLWMSEHCPKNSESRFIGWSLRQLKNVKPPLILISYADTAQKHRGGIYMATNWIYVGLSDERKCGDKSIDGKHSRHGSKASEKLKTFPRSRKHRFVYFFNQNDKSLLKWKQGPYPNNPKQQRDLEMPSSRKSRRKSSDASGLSTT